MRGQKMGARDKRDIEMKGGSSHNRWNTEDEGHQYSACECRLEKLHEAFHVSCTFSNAFQTRQVHLSSFAMAATSLKHGGAEKELRRRVGAVSMLTNTGNGGDHGSTSNDDDANGDSRHALSLSRLKKAA
ncbi:MAG: hypothetical protein JSR99_16600 [Proteobacteria bacterium]|nr:hypothetical protein [Pseudomonadota bacterium]